MNRNELHSLRRSIQKALDNGWEPEPGSISMGCDISFDPCGVVITFASDHVPPLFLDPFFAVLRNDWALAFWGKELIGNQYFGLLPAWQYHQHKLLSFLQGNDTDSFIAYIELFL